MEWSGSIIRKKLPKGGSFWNFQDKNINMMSLVLWCHCLGHVSSKDCASVIFYLADKCTKVIIWVNISTPHLIFLQHENNSCHAPRDFLYTCPLLLLKQEQHNFVIILLEHFQMALDTIQILGGNGYLNDYPAGWDEHKMNYFFWWNDVLFQGDFYVTQRFMRLGLELKRWKTQYQPSVNDTIIHNNHNIVKHQF